MHWYTDVLRKYTLFEGRAAREEYWAFTLISVMLAFTLAGVETAIGIRPVLTAAYSLAVLLPSMAVAVRRLHDTGRTGWWLLLALIPVAGAIVLIIYLAGDSDPKTNAYGVPAAAGPMGTGRAATG
ncbi:DUF805 domain-containing protein [Streptomyces sp. NBC_00557]|uniref:DUF805 domain-containing protein n=1 Tax=Streptomyces sp. NBC_00557 TaxID=2975776 RepID=UPI002E806DC7|nr:DUF805 domain-containing protein [Streptomyces sp. NBC_00557]WUC40223.1 DUF805 domain-containing protein [Streptomyces sp. NBC_00557]